MSGKGAVMSFKMAKQCGCLLAILVIVGTLATVQARPSKTLKIGTVGSLAPAGKSEAADAILKDFVKIESDLTADLIKQKSWQELADNLASKNIQVGIFQGFEFPWAQQRRPSIKPM